MIRLALLALVMALGCEASTRVDLTVGRGVEQAVRPADNPSTWLTVTRPRCSDWKRDEGICDSVSWFREHATRDDAIAHLRSRRADDSDRLEIWHVSNRETVTLRTEADVTAWSPPPQKEPRK